MKIYTRTGDDGTTSLIGGRRVPKCHVRVEAYGTVDEVISWIGLIRDFRENNGRKQFLIYIQDQLMLCSAALAEDPSTSAPHNILPEPDCISMLEKEIDIMEKKLKPLDGFILPGGHILVSYCHIARCISRRAERCVSELNQTEKTPAIVSEFMNRLSDYLFVLSRSISKELDSEEIKWQI
jgi:cob(I)alamin adenosyltransferase